MPGLFLILGISHGGMDGDRQTEKHQLTQLVTERNRHTAVHTYLHIDRQTGRQATDIQTQETYECS